MEIARLHQGFGWRWPMIACAGFLAGRAHGLDSSWLLAVVALVPLLLALRTSRRPFLLGWLFGTVAWCTAIPWIVPTMTTYGFVSGWLAGVGLVLLAAFLGLYDALFCRLGARIWRRGDALSLAALPALWVALEVARGTLASGFPWNLAAYAWIEVPGTLTLSSLVGAWGVSYLAVLVSVLLARAIVARRWEPAVLAVAVPMLLLATAARFAGPDPVRRTPRPVRVVQPNIPNRPFFDAAASAADYRRLLAMTAEACNPGALVLWPESATWPRHWQSDTRMRNDLNAFAVDRGCSVLLNSAWESGPKTYNSVLLVSVADGSGPAPVPAPGERLPPDIEGLRTQRADKRHLVPFGEYVPFRRWLPFLGTIARTVGDFSSAEEIELLGWRGERLGAAVCYEVVFPGETAALVRSGATALVTVTNDAWYGDTAAPRQHLRAARFRAAENRRWLLRAAVTGISAIVRPDGTLADSAGVGETKILEGAIVGRRDRTLYSRAPWLVPALATLLALVAIFRARYDLAPWDT